jgi:predicted dehydrogenase
MRGGQREGAAMAKRFGVTRRRFLGVAGLGAGLTLPHWYAEEILDARQPAPAASASDSLRFGLIGCGGQGKTDAKNAERFGRIVAICDVDANQVANARKDFPTADTYSDFRKLIERKDIDAVICGTVDHWHMLVSVAAMRAGKDVYCEKPLTLTIAEGRHIVEAQRQAGRILQTGTQQRSSVHLRLAVDLVRNNRIGTLKQVEVWLPAGLRQGPFQVTAVPEGFDYDFWLGQTPKVPYVKERTHFSFRYWWEYSGGTMTDWGAHHNDIVLWALGLDDSGPVSVEGKQLVEMIPDGFTAASEYELKYTYANGVEHFCRSTTASEWNGSVKDPNGQQHGIKFIGTDGWIWTTRGYINANDRELLRQRLPASAPRVYLSNDHMQNFVECVKSRKAPICPAEVGHRSASQCHLGVIAIRLGRKVHWDPARERFVDDPEAERYLSREMRAPYDLGFI